MSGDTQLPEGFADLAPYLGWALPRETERMLRRAEAAQADVEAFCGAMMASLDRIIAHLGAFSLDGMPAPEARLYAMLLSLAEIAPAIEFYRQPNVIEGFDPRRFLPVEDSVLRPAW